MSEAEATTPLLETGRRKRSLWPDSFVRLVRGKPLGTIGGIIVLAMLVTGILADLLAPYGMLAMDTKHILESSSAKHLLGTDNLGRDVLSRVIYGARISMIVSVAGSALSIFIAVVIGLFSGYFGGKFDIVVQRFVDAWMCLPSLFLILTIMAITGPGLVQVIVVLGLINGIRSSRVVRSAVIGIKENVYVVASITVGCSDMRVLGRHILPNVLAPVIILFTITMGFMILAEATISFLGYGIPPPQPSWGGMLGLEGRRYMELSPTLALWPGLALALVVFGVNMLGDAVRDVLDPRLKGGLGRYEGMKLKKEKKKSA